MELMNKTAAELSTLLASKEISAVELAKAALARTEAVDSQVGAYITTAGDAALAAAETIDKRRAPAPPGRPARPPPPRRHPRRHQRQHLHRGPADNLRLQDAVQLRPPL